MCGRYTLTREESEFPTRHGRGVFQIQTKPRYNIAPTQRVPVLLLEKGQPVVKEMRWGFQPKWATKNLINAQAETVWQKPTFKKAWAERRCLIPADGFYEWKTVPGGKLPMRFVLGSGEMFCFAGLWEPWLKPVDPEDLFDTDLPDEPPPSQVVESFVILTTAANAVVSPVHDRMPAIVKTEHFDWWLDPKGGERLITVMNHPRNGELEVYPVGPLVNSVRNDEPRCIARVSPPR